MGFRFRLLGPLRVEHDGVEIAIGAAKLRVLLCALLVAANRVVSLDELSARVWERGTPGVARSTLQSYVMRLRRLLGTDELIETHPGGYLIRVDEDELDLVAFGRLVGEATDVEADDPETAVGLLRAALALWRGEPLADVPSDGLRRAVVPALTERYLTATEHCVEGELRLDRPGRVLAELAELTARYPLRERFWALRMRALYAAGRRDEALACFAELAGILAGELGTAPTERLRELHDAILAGTLTDPAPPHRPDPAPVNASVNAPNSLPADKVDFTGRARERDLLLGPEPSPVRVIDGMAGIGKTTLAVHVAHELSASCPDAALFIDLHAHSDGRPPMPPSDALDALLRMLGVPGEQIPDSLDERAARWRAELAGRRALLVLDNASDAAQIRPLLPGSPDCPVLVTSRRRLADLDGAQPLFLDVLPGADALALFTGMVGAARASADRVATEQLLRSCGHLPLAIRIVGARLRARPSWSVVDMLGRLTEAHRRSGELVTGDRSVSAAFALSYRHLAEPQRRLFRLLGLHPGPDLDGRLAAALAGVDVDTAEAGLEDLVDVHLVESTGPDRYRFHDLLREHARELAERTDPAPERAAALRRLLEAHLHTAIRAARLLRPPRQHLVPDAPEHPVEGPAFADGGQALAWLDAQHANLLAEIGLAQRTPDLAEFGWQLPHAISFFFRRRGHIQDWINTHEHALAVTAGDPHTSAVIGNSLGRAHQYGGSTLLAVDNFQRALELFRETGDVPGESSALANLGGVYWRLGRIGEAIEWLEQSRDSYRAAGDQQGEADLLTNLANAYHSVGRYPEALGLNRRAVEFYRTTGNRARESMALGNLGTVHHAMGNYAEAIECHRRSMILGAGVRRWAEAMGLTNLGTVYRAIGRHAEALDLQQRAVHLATVMADPSVECELRNELGTTLRAVGEIDRAIDEHRRALDMAVALLERIQEADAHLGLAKALRDRDRPTALRHWRQALAIHTELGVAKADDVRAELNRFTSAAAGRRR